ncbi:MAG: hypothetical protein Q9M36_08180 [Sulfurovum sp.]|nr:hypothetical protein [Sulfurovum sp.]
MKNILTLTSFTLILLGCGGGSSSGSNKTFSGAIVVSEVYTVFPGDSIVKHSDPAIINIIHKEGQSESTIELIEGNVTILRKP